MGGGKGGGSNSAQIDFQKQQAEEARQKEVERQARLTQGSDAINNAFSGFGDGFYNKFKQANLDYYQPELARQYAKSSSDLNYSLARAGQLQSSTAGDKLADLVYQKDLNDAQISSKADAATGELRNTVSANKQAAINQLYSTEDPTMAANTATGMVRNVELTQPSFSPIGELFKPIAIGVGSGLTGYNNAKNYQPSGANDPNKSSGIPR